MAKSKRIATTSTSKSTADVELLVLRPGETVRLVFQPSLRSNPHNREAAVGGTFVYQKKNRVGAWIAPPALPLSKLRADEWIKLELHSGEVLTLFQALQDWYGVFEQFGVPVGRREFIAVSPNSAVNSFVKAVEDSPDLLAANNHDLIVRFLQWIGRADPARLTERLATLPAAELVNFDVLLGAARLRQFLSLMEANMDNPSEEFWHQEFKKNSWILSQLFAFPTVILGDKVYVGGKGIDNTGSSIADFAYRSELTDNVALVEIKTPMKRLLHPTDYRDNAYAPSDQLAGATVQVLQQRASLMENYALLAANSRQNFRSWSPKGLLLIGSVGRDCTDENRTRSFELYRQNVSNVEIVTFDELAAKIRNLLRILEGMSQSK
jgi:Domain of unknown function (DUF4263)